MDNLLQFNDSVPCKIRAKRGFATHPRSIAERVREYHVIYICAKTCFHKHLVWNSIRNDERLCENIILTSTCCQVRRTRISERIRKLQELVPNMEKVRINKTEVDLPLDCFVFGM